MVITTLLEEAVLKLITSRIAELSKGAVQKDSAALLTPSAVAVAVLEGEFKRVTTRWHQGLTVSILVKFKNMTSEAARRKGINPIVQGIVQLLLDKDLGLPVSRLAPRRFRDVTTREKYEQGLIEYLVEFETTHTLAPLEEEEAMDLLRIGLEYSIKPGDDLADAADLVELQEGA